MEAPVQVGVRRHWSEEAKGRIVVESHAPGARVADVARRRSVAPQPVTTGRREARKGELALPIEDETEFAQLALEDTQPRPPAFGDAIEIEQDDVTIRLPADAFPERIAAAAAALRRARR